MPRVAVAQTGTSRSFEHAAIHDQLFDLFSTRGLTMKNLTTILNPGIGFRVTLLAVVLCSLATVFLLYAAPAQSVTLTVTNNSTREIRHLYLSPAENDNWGSDQLNNSAIGVGATRTLNLAWEQAALKLIGEDQDGCFLSATVNVASNVEWTITNDTPLDCGN
jgi:hypothetical protein